MAKIEKMRRAILGKIFKKKGSLLGKETKKHKGI